MNETDKANLSYSERVEIVVEGLILQREKEKNIVQLRKTRTSSKVITT